MKVQDVKKECLANVGLSIELSNSEVDSVVSLVRDLDISIQKGKADLASHVSHIKQIDSEFAKSEDHGAFGKAQFNPDNATVTIDLKSLVRAFMLLDTITNNRAFNSSHLFDAADNVLDTMLTKINNGQI